jgi:hypothetical protein
MEPYMNYLFARYHGASVERNTFMTIWSPHNREQKMWHCVLDRLFQAAIVNAAIIMRMVNPTRTSSNGWLRDFRRSLMHDMITRSREFIMSLDPKRKERWGNP